MKRVIAVMVLMVLLAAAAVAQQNYRFVRADIPFNFQVNGHTMPAGKYDFCWNRSFVAAVKLVSTTNADQPIRYAQVSAVENEAKDGTAKVIFRQTGATYVLRAIKQPGEGRVNLSMPKDQMKYQLARDVEIEAQAGK
ncbi:MAG TPA: hypothetical protein VN577_03415 [Terriglobales bacterium]|nr:hypothetical protein [Terriglobales bacterium]